MLPPLREAVRGYMGERRYRHTLAVEREARRLAELYLPQNIPMICAAALLHDITKEQGDAAQLALCERYGIPVSPHDRISPRTLHAKTAPAVILRDFPAFADPVLLDAVRKHTTGDGEMSLAARILYLSDYIEETRTYPDCVALRKSFWEAAPNLPPERLAHHLTSALLHAVDYTIGALCREGLAIAPATVAAHNLLIAEINSDIS